MLTGHCDPQRGNSFLKRRCTPHPSSEASNHTYEGGRNEAQSESVFLPFNKIHNPGHLILPGKLEVVRKTTDAIKEMSHRTDVS